MKAKYLFLRQFCLFSFMRLKDYASTCIFISVYNVLESLVKSRYNLMLISEDGRLSSHLHPSFIVSDTRSICSHHCWISDAVRHKVGLHRVIKSDWRNTSSHYWHDWQCPFVIVAYTDTQLTTYELRCLQHLLRFSLLSAERLMLICAQNMISCHVPLDYNYYERYSLQMTR